MFGAVKTRRKERNSENPGGRMEDKKDQLKKLLNDELTDLEKLLSEEAKLKQLAEEKRQEISKAIERWEGKMTLFKEEVEKIQLQFRHILENKEMAKKETESELIIGGGELQQMEGGEECRVGPEQAELELRLQSKEEENNLLKKQMAELEEQFRIEREQKEQEIQELKKRLEEISGGQESG